jgi:hypothetical protein
MDLNKVSGPQQNKTKLKERARQPNVMRGGIPGLGLNPILRFHLQRKRNGIT